MAANPNGFLIEAASQVIGKCGMWDLPEIGYFLDPRLWGRGLMAEALRCAIPYFLNANALPALTAKIDPRIIASLRRLNRLGFAETHRAENFALGNGIVRQPLPAA